jgi:hypothetical protein
MEEDPFDAIKRQVWARDGRRCQECGIPVAVRGGAKPQTHHMIPPSAGGPDDPANLITLCQPCHATKLGHTFMLAQTSADDYPQYIKWSLLDLATNLQAYADAYNPLRPPPAHAVIKMLDLSKRALDNVEGVAVECERRGIGSGEIPLPGNYDEEQRELEGIIAGLRIAWQSHHMQRALDDTIRDGKRA